MKFCLILLAVLPTISSLRVDFYEHRNFGGSHAWCDNLENHSYCNLATFNDRTSSIFIRWGSCVTVHDYSPPAGQNMTISYLNGREVRDLMGTGLNDRISSVKQCSLSTKAQNCPAGTFVKTFAIASDRYGFQAKCFLPSNKTHAAATMSIGTTAGMQTIRDCNYGAVRGVTINRNTNLEATTVTGADCNPTTCKGNTAVCGFTSLVESNTNLMKYTSSNQLTVRCCDVGDPAKLCNPYDFLQPILTCDNLEALAPTTCTYSETIGIGNSTSAGEGGSTERSFYSEMGYSFGASGYGLSANFHENVGQSNKTSFNWSTASSQTWNQEVTTTVGMEVPPCMKTELFQAVGECSFFSVHARFYKRVDTMCNGTVIESLVTDPRTMELAAMASIAQDN